MSLPLLNSNIQFFIHLYKKNHPNDRSVQYQYEYNFLELKLKLEKAYEAADAENDTLTKRYIANYILKLKELADAIRARKKEAIVHQAVIEIIEAAEDDREINTKAILNAILGFVVVAIVGAIIGGVASALLLWSVAFVIVSVYSCETLAAVFGVMTGLSALIAGVVGSEHAYQDKMEKRAKAKCANEVRDATQQIFGDKEHCKMCFFRRNATVEENFSHVTANEVDVIPVASMALSK